MRRPNVIIKDVLAISQKHQERNERGGAGVVGLVMTALIGTGLLVVGLVALPDPTSPVVIVPAELQPCDNIGSNVPTTSGGELDGTDPDTIIDRSFFGRVKGPVQFIARQAAEADTKATGESAAIIVDAMHKDEVMQNTCRANPGTQRAGQVVLNQQGTLLVQLETGIDLHKYLTGPASPGEQFNEQIILPPIVPAV